MSTPDPLLDKEQIAVQLHCHWRTALDLMSDGRIRSTKPGRKRLARQSWVDAYVNSLADGGPNVRLVGRRSAS